MHWLYFVIDCCCFYYFVRNNTVTKLCSKLYVFKCRFGFSIFGVFAGWSESTVRFSEEGSIAIVWRVCVWHQRWCVCFRVWSFIATTSEVTASRDSEGVVLWVPYCSRTVKHESCILTYSPDLSESVRALWRCTFFGSKLGRPIRFSLEKYGISSKFVYWTHCFIRSSDSVFFSRSCQHKGVSPVAASRLTTTYEYCYNSRFSSLFTHLKRIRYM